MIRMGKRFSMKTEYWEITIKEGTASRLTLEMVFLEKTIPLSELKKLWDAIKLLLEATGRLEFNPSTR